MLNRRLIRIRAMQSLYAYELSKKANFLLAEDLIKETFAPDLNSIIKQDRPKLEGLTKLGIQQFHEDHSLTAEADDFELPTEVKKAVNEASILYRERNKTDFSSLTLRTLKDTEKVFEIYTLLLALYLALAKMAEADKTHEGRSKLGSNKLLKALAAHEEFGVMYLKQNSHWDGQREFIKEVYNDVLKKNTKYIEYCEKLNHTEEEEIALLKYMVKNVFLKNKVCTGYFERYHLYWSEDRETLRAMVSHTFQNYPTDGELRVASPTDEWQERKEFLMTLFKNSVNDEENLMELIMPSLKNWEYDRIADTDRVILKMALVEFMEFPSIPVKVTINEFIEIAKTYSTPKSGQFINGVLDRLSKDMITKGNIRKTGRGMIDNK